jgi:hypothetical protein
MPKHASLFAARFAVRSFGSYIRFFLILFCAFTEKVGSYLTKRSSFGGGGVVMISEIYSVALKLP